MREFKQTTAQRKIAAMRKRVRIVQGGTSASKTFSILPMLITYAALNPNKEISIVAETFPHLRRGALKDFQAIMRMTGQWRDDSWNAGVSKYIFHNGSYIEFFSVEQEQKVRGARRDVLFGNECNSMRWETYQQLAIRTREFIYLDYNPSVEFWVHTELIGDKDTDFVVLTYKDNEALEPALVKEIEKAKEKAETSTYWANWWRVYGLGMTGTTQNAVFDNYELIDSINRAEVRFVALGLDWGFSADPTALIAVYRKGEDIYVEELIYERGLTNQDIADRMKHLGIDRDWEIIADSAEPKSIEEVYRMGFNIKAVGYKATKLSIDILRRRKIFVTKSSVNMIKELRNYVYITDKAEQSTGVPVDAFNHTIDALRYVALSKLGHWNSGEYFIV
jgi:phage terminase large subunit